MLSIKQYMRMLDKIELVIPLDRIKDSIS
uniref:Uncharacterized protein n=1 Tax=Tetranychus urticae TaxID=32264 RepID=T1KPN0_TETUR